MVPHAGVLLDDGGHTRQRPQIGAEAVGARPLEKPALDLRELLGMELGPATGSTGGAQRRQATLLPGPVPATDALAAGVERARHKGQLLAAAEELRSFEAALLQCCCARMIMSPSVPNRNVP